MAERSDKPANLVDHLSAAIAGASGEHWRAARIMQARGRLQVALSLSGEPDSASAPSELSLEIRPDSEDAQAYRRVRGLCFAYRAGGQSLSKPVLRRLDAVIQALAGALAESGFDLTRDVLASAEEREAGFPTPYHYHHLHSERRLPDELIERYRSEGHLLVRRALNPDVVRAALPVLSKALERRWPHDQPPVAERADAYAQSFTQITDIGTSAPLVRVFSNLRRITAMCAQLMGVSSVRLFCEDWLIKDPDARITPWHQDAAVFPFDAEATITAWIPLRDVPEGHGLLRFARGAHHLGLAHIEGKHGFSQEGFAAYIEAQGLTIDHLPPVLIGDVSFHDGRMIHGAFPNTSGEHRAVLALHCFAEGATIKHEPTPHMQRTLAGAAPHLSGGDPARCDAWPLVYGPESSGPPRIELAGVPPSKDSSSTRVSAFVLPGGEARALVIERGLLHIEALGADDPAPTHYATAGLVECHGHISYPHTRSDPVSELRWMNPRRADYAETGVTLIRDMGATDDAVCKLLDAPGLPRVHATGIMILRKGDWPFTRTEPEDLVEACVARVEQGARWVKIFADFADDYQGRVDPGFTGVDEVTYPLERLRAAVDAVHERGARVAAHCFTHAGTAVAVHAGVDTLEHGWGVDEALLEHMLERGTAWAPLVGISRAMWDIAARDGHSERHTWLRETMDSLARMLPLAERRGVTLLAGTDRFPMLTVGDEIRQLHRLGVSREAALAAGTWAARAYLGEPGLEQGAPADLVLYPRDPRVELELLDAPARIFIGGREVLPSLARVRPNFAPFWPPASES